MALSNIFREPRREITEQVVGSLLVGGVLLGLFEFDVHWIVPTMGYKVGDRADYIGAVVLGFLLVILGIFVAVFLVVAMHAFGDFVCEMLEDHGIQLRPKQRYR